MADQNTVRTAPLRMPESLHQQIKEVARVQRRSMNSQIIVLLEKALPDDGAGRTEAA